VNGTSFAFSYCGTGDWRDAGSGFRMRKREYDEREYDVCENQIFTPTFCISVYSTVRDFVSGSVFSVVIF
jgi:hypothetical protein